MPTINGGNRDAALLAGGEAVDLDRHGQAWLPDLTFSGRSTTTLSVRGGLVEAHPLARRWRGSACAWLLLHRAIGSAVT